MEPQRATEKTQVLFVEDQLKGLVNLLANLLSLLSPRTISETPSEDVVVRKKKFDRPATLP